jgi:hypothetical protein
MNDGVADITKPKRHRLAKVFRVLLIVVLLLAVTLSLVWIIGAPRYAEHLLKRKLAGYWDGSVTVASSHVTLAGEVTFTDLRFFDAEGTQWATTDSLGTQLINWPSRSPSIDELTVTGLNVTAPLDHRPPVQKPAPTTSKGGLRKIHLIRSDITIMQEDGYTIDVEDINLMLTQSTPGQWDIDLRALAEGDALMLTGKVTRSAPTDDASAIRTNEFAGQLTYGPDTADFDLTLERHANAFRLTADLDFDVRTIVGKTHLQSICQKNPDSSHEFETLLTTQGQDGQTRTNTYATAHVTKPGGQLKVETRLNTQVIAFGGRGTFVTDAILQDGHDPDIHSDGIIRGMSLPEVLAFAKLGKTDQGTLEQFTWDARATGFGLADVTGEGTIALDDMGLLPGTDLYRLLRDLSLDVSTNGIADVTGKFDLRDSKLVVQEGLLGGDIYAVAAEAGGIIDPRTGELDLTVVTFLLPETYHLLKQIPGINLLTLFGDNLTRSRVTGTLGAPIITPTPFQNGSGSATDWFWDLLKSGPELDELPAAPQDEMPLAPIELDFPND